MDSLEATDQTREEFYAMRRKHRQIRREAWLKAKDKTEDKKDEKTDKQ
jgi:hypothetical protein